MKKKRVLYLFLLFISAFITGMFMGRALAMGVSFNLIDLIPWFSGSSLLLALISILLAFNFLKKSRGFHSLYQEEMDDNLNETYYVQMYRNLEFGTIASNIVSVTTLLAFFISATEVLILGNSYLTLVLSLLGLMLLFVVQKYLLKTISIVRQFDLAFFSMPKDVLDYVNSYDEGERQANLEQSFRVLFQLNQYVLHGLYILITIVSVLTREIQLLALLAVAVVHIYINLMQIPMIKCYFK